MASSNEFVAYLGSGENTIQSNDRPQDAWTLVSYEYGAAGLDAAQISQIATAGRFGSDTGRIDDLLDTYVFQNSSGQQVVIYTDAEHVILNRTDFAQGGEDAFLI